MTYHEDDDCRSGSADVYQAHPLRIQRKRTKGWRMPEGAVYVGRPSKWGNPMSVNLAVGRTLDDVMKFFRAYAEKFIANYRPNCDPQYRGLNIEELRGKQLACWCPLDKPCHADILAELANRDVRRVPRQYEEEWED